MPPEPPVSLGYRMPAEWEPHAAPWMAWPHNRDTWPHQLESVQTIYVRMMAALQEQESVNLLVSDAAMAVQVSQTLAAHGLSRHGLHLYHCPTADAWLRDSGPIFLTAAAGTARPAAVVDWRFNAGGEKYPEMLTDNS